MPYNFLFMQSFVGDLLLVAILPSAWTLLLLVNFKVHYWPQLASEVGSDLIRSPIFKDALQLSFYAIFCNENLDRHTDIHSKFIIDLNWPRRLDLTSSGPPFLRVPYNFHLMKIFVGGHLLKVKFRQTHTYIQSSLMTSIGLGGRIWPHPVPHFQGCPTTFI